MGTIDDELKQYQEDTQREIAFIRKQLPSDLKELYSDSQMEWMLDAIADYFYDSGILETNDDEVDVDIDEVAEYICKRAAEENFSTLQADEVRFVVEADLDFQEQNL